MPSDETTKLNALNTRQKDDDQQENGGDARRGEETRGGVGEAEAEEEEEEEEGKNEQITEISAFEKVMNEVGSEGRFQKFLIWCFVVPLAFCNALGNSNTTLLLTTPSHSCHVPGRPENLSLEAWKNITVPWEESHLGQMQLSSCSMFNVSEGVSADEDLLGQPGDQGHLDTKRSIIECRDAWDFDTSSWVETPVSQFGWVCQHSDTVILLFSLKYAGNAIGTLCFSIISDRYGRKPVIFLLLALNAACILPFIFAPNFLLYGIFTFLISLPYNSIYQIPYIIVLELCGAKSRLALMMASFVSNVVATCLVPAIAFGIARWKVFVAVCHLPAVVFFCYYRLVPESPRWLLSEGRLAECEAILRRIARFNGKPFAEGSHRLLQQAQEEEERCRGKVKDILLSRTLVKHLGLTCVLLSIGFFVFSGTMINIHNMTGSKFVNFFILSFVGVPANILGGTCSKYLGRRVSATIFYGLMALSCFIATLVVEYPWALTTVCAVIKMFCSAGILTVFMQIGELFPTALRATAYGVVSITASVAAIFVPPVIALGSTNVLAPYYVLGGLGVLGLTTSTFLPETVGRPLPQTLHEALRIGRNQPYFGLVHKWNAHKYQV